MTKRKIDREDLSPLDKLGLIEKRITEFEEKAKDRDEEWFDYGGYVGSAVTAGVFGVVSFMFFLLFKHLSLAVISTALLWNSLIQFLNTKRPK